MEMVKLSAGQMTIEISKASSQFPEFSIKESCSNHEEQDFQGLSNLHLEHQEDLPSPYEYVASNYDKELDACYESAAQKSNKDLFSFDISCKDIIVEEEIDSCDKPAYHHDEFRLCEGEQKDSD